MITFWTTPRTIQSIFGSNYKTYPVFGMTHLLELGFAILIIMIISLIYRKLDNKKRDKILFVTTILIVIDELFKYAFTIPTNQWTWSYLPLHLCSINVFTTTIHTITKSNKIKEFLYALCLPGAILALISAPWLTAPVMNAMHIHSYTIHVLLILYPILLLAGGYRPTSKSILSNAIILICIAIPIFFINKALNTNFLYINDPSEVFITKFLYDLFGNFYVVSFPILICIVWLVMYLPWNIRKTKSINEYN